MITRENHIGKIIISDKYIRELIWNTVAGSFGVSGVNEDSLFGDILPFLKKKNTHSNGVNIVSKDNKLIINLKISVTCGTNISAIVKSLRHRVSFVVEEATGIKVSKVNVFIDSVTQA
ncbi:MAG: Asp23/Gls24 family envelope stress response protein [Oscillospiraceae bacterium]|nr:Asp23/Gls24 family envelope stress response protein [Oscillospiraceae bacterium]MBQ9981969.1 Asp23/Gls24 family envelope stress response protein [Oscillospiraceae bacterium]